MATWTDVSRLMKALPGTVRAPGRREWRVSHKLLAWERPLREADRVALGASAPTGSILAVHAPLVAKEILLASRPKVYFTTPHFDGWPAILVRLPVIPVDEFRELLRRSWLERASKKAIAEMEGAKPRSSRRGRGAKR